MQSPWQGHGGVGVGIVGDESAIVDDGVVPVGCRGSAASFKPGSCPAARTVDVRALPTVPESVQER
jgi:hypothetical protein